MINEPKKQELPIELSIAISDRDGQPCIYLRRCTTDLDLMKLIISSAYHGRPLIFLPRFNNQLQGLRSLIDKGLLYYQDGQYFFTV